MPDALPFVMNEKEVVAAADLQSLSEDPEAGLKDIALWYSKYVVQSGCSILRLTRILWSTFEIEIL